MSEWKNVPKDLEKYQGFVYEIKNKMNCMSYIGSKNFWKENKRKITLKPNKAELDRLNRYLDNYNCFKKGGKFPNPLKAKEYKTKYELFKKHLKKTKAGKKKTITKRVETDWRNYWSSSEGKLKDDIEKYGKENFERIIIGYFRTRFEVKYYEAQQQFERDVLFSSNYYNKIIEIKSGSCPKHLID